MVLCSAPKELNCHISNLVPASKKMHISITTETYQWKKETEIRMTLLK